MNFKVLLLAGSQLRGGELYKYQERRGSEEMKHLLMGELRKPYEENRKKMYEIEKKRTEKGEAFGDAIIFPQHALLSKAYSSFMVVDCSEETLAKWIAAYQGVADFKIHPIMARSEFEKYMS